MDTENISTKEKTTFALAVLAIAITVNSFKIELTNLKILVGNNSINSYNLLLYLLILMIFTAYLFCLNYIIFDFRGKIYQPFRFTKRIADWCFNITFMAPIAFIAVALTTNTLMYIINYFIDLNTNLVRLLTWSTGVFTGVITAYLARKSIESLNSLLDERLETKVLELIDEAKKLRKNKFYSQSVFETFKAIETLLIKTLDEKGYATNHLSSKYLFELALQNELINNKLYLELGRLRQQRNNVAHSNSRLSAQDANNAIKTYIDTIENIKTKEEKKHSELDKLKRLLGTIDN